MMHYDQYVVAITNPNGKAYREFESERLTNGRKSKIYLPFDSEYKILIKNNSDRRAKLTIDLDGTSISGMGGLILDAYKTESLERFVDVAKKFLFVRKNDERVSDPTSGENGILKVRIEKEYQSMPYILTTTVWPGPHHTMSDNAWYNNQTTIVGSAGLAPMGQVSDNPTYTAQVSQVNCSYSAPVKGLNPLTDGSRVVLKRSAKPLKKSLLNEESGATVEGGNSSQSFGTTIWNGTDGIPFEFIFKLLGQQGVSDETRTEYQKFLELKKKFEG